MADPLQDNTSGISGLFNQMDEDGKPAIVVETTNRDGQPRVKFEMDQATANSITSSLKNYQKTIDAMNTRVSELQQRETRQRQNPLFQVLSSVSGNLAASDRRLPPVVQALGRSNLELNPTADKLARERLGVTEQVGKMEETKLLAQERLAALKQTKEIATEQREADRDVRRQGLLEKAVEYVGKNAYSPESAKEAQKVYKLTDDQTKMLEGIIAGRKQKELEKENFQTRMSKHREDVQMRIQQMRERMSRERLDKMQSMFGDRQSQISERQRTGREDRAYSKVEKDTTAALTTIAGTQHMREVLNDPKNTKYIGMILGRVPTDAIPDEAERQRVADVKAEFFTLMNDVRNSFGAGTRFWNPTEFSNLSPKLAQSTKTLAADRGIIDAIERDAIRNAKKMVQASPDVDWNTRGPDVFGSLWPEVSQGLKLPALQGPAGERTSKEKETSTTPSKSDYDKWLEQKKNAGQQ